MDESEKWVGVSGDFRKNDEKIWKKGSFFEQNEIEPT